jgi:hypothetical protein
MRLPTLRSEARNLIDRSGKFRSVRTWRMTSPTTPVAPTTARLGRTYSYLSIEAPLFTTSSVLGEKGRLATAYPLGSVPTEDKLMA